MTGQKATSSGGPGLSRFIVPTLFIGLVAIPVLYYGLNSEIARWKAAQAQLCYEGGDFEEAIGLFEESVELAPHDNELQLRLAEKLMVHQRASEALERIERVIANSIDPQSAMRLKATCLLYLDRTNEALLTLKSISDYLTPRDFDEPNRLNDLAYFRALAGTELVIAQDNIDQAIEVFEKRIWPFDPTPMPLLDQTLAATAMIARKVGLEDSIFDLLNRRIEIGFESLRQISNKNSKSIYDSMSRRLSMSEDDETTIWYRQHVRNSHQQHLSYLLTLRALMHQDMGMAKKSEQDRLRIELLGHKAEEIVEKIPDDWELMEIMLQGAMFLDTKAMVTHARTAGHQDAVRDMDVAVIAFETLAATNSGDLQNTIRNERGDRLDAMQLKRYEATIRSNRAQMQLSRGQRQKAEIDFQRIEELGFDRNEALY